MDRWDVLIIAGAAYVAIMTLVRLMVARRNQLVDHVRQQIEQQQPSKPANQDEASKEKNRGAA